MNINLTRQQLAILGGLLLTGYLVFCCFGYTMGRGTAPEQAPTQAPAVVDVPQSTTKPPDTPTPAPTLAPTDTPMPTNTPIPTATPTKVFPTPTRVFPTATPLPTHTPIPAGPSDEVQSYLLEAAAKLESMGVALGDLGTLLQNPRWWDEDWVVVVRVYMGIIQLRHEELAAMDVPPEMAELHSALLDATGDFYAAMDHLSRGIDNLNVADVETAAALMAKANKKLENPQRALEEYLAQFENPPER
jgi:hypothetical protein